MSPTIWFCVCGVFAAVGGCLGLWWAMRLEDKFVILALSDGLQAAREKYKVQMWALAIVLAVSFLCITVCAGLLTYHWFFHPVLEV